MPTCVTPAAADAVLIFWDSDISDVNEDILSDSSKHALRETYRTNLLGTLDTIRKSGESSFSELLIIDLFYYDLISGLSQCV